MKIRRFYSEQGLNGRGEIVISGDEHYHLKNVLRFKNGEELELFDGQGHLFKGSIIKSDSNDTVVRIVDRISEKDPEVKIITAVSILKRKAMFSLIENLSEIGVDEIRPVIFYRTDVGHNLKNIEKWEKLSLMSLKVNGKLWPSKIFPPQNFKDFICFSQGVKNKIILDLEGKRKYVIKKAFPVLVVIGPPGDFTSEERKILVENGFNSIKINDCTLRSEIAALSISAILKTYL